MEWAVRDSNSVSGRKILSSPHRPDCLQAHPLSSMPSLFFGTNWLSWLGRGQIYFLAFTILISFSHLCLVLLRSLLSCVFQPTFSVHFSNPLRVLHFFALLILRDRKLTFTKCGFMFSSTCHILRSTFFFAAIINNDTAINSVDNFAIYTEVQTLCSKFLHVYYIVLTFRLIILSGNYWLSLPVGSFIVLL